MKKSLLYYIVICLLAVASCKKEDKIPSLERVPVPSLKLDPTSDKQISPGNPTGFHGKIIVDLFFESDVPPKKMDIVIIKNGNKSASKSLLANVTTYPVTIDITGQQLVTLFGEPIADGDLFEVGADITTQDGKVFLAFPPGGTGYGSGVAFQAGGVQTSIQFIKPCTFVSALYQGSFKVVSDQWEDYASGDVVPVTRIDDTHFSFQYLTSPSYPIIVTVNPADNSISVTRQSYGKYGSTELFAESVPGTSSVNPCDLSFSLQLKHTNATGGNYGNYTIILKK